MMVYDYKDYNLYCFGDIHGEFKTLFHEIKRRLQNPNYRKKNDKDKTSKKMVFIVCGDCGIGFNKPSYYEDLFSDFNKFLEKEDLVLLFVRGNHDDKSYFDGESVNYSRIKAIPDYSVVMTSNLTTLCVGGAISIDRSWRKQQEALINRYKPISSKKKIYWDDEKLLYDEDKLNEIIHNGIHVDSVITHALPSEFPYVNLDASNGWFLIDNKLKDDFASEKEELTKIIEFLTSHDCDIMVWTNGHIHKNVCQVVELCNGKKTYWRSMADDFRDFDVLSAKLEIERIRNNSDGENKDENANLSDFRKMSSDWAFLYEPMRFEVRGDEAIGDEEQEELLDDVEEALPHEIEEDGLNQPF